MRNATIEVIKFLTEEKGLSVPKASSLASIDFVASEVVDHNQLDSALIPKKYFLEKPFAPCGHGRHPIRGVAAREGGLSGRRSRREGPRRRP